MDSTLHDNPTEPDSGSANTQNTPTFSTDSVAAPRSSRPGRILARLLSPGTSLGGAPEKRLALLALLIACASVFVTSMDMTVVVTALPQIIADPGINLPITQLDHASWIVSAYLLGFVIVMPLMGRISDIYGRRRILLLCLTIFGLGSVLCALAPLFSQSFDISFLSAFSIDTTSQGLVWLIAARLIQAVGGGAVVPVAIAVVSDFYGKERLGLALGIIGAVTEAGGVAGPLYGALIVSTLGWTYIFYLNIPIVLLLILGAWFFTPSQRHAREGIDWLGTLLLGISLTCLSLGLAQQGTDLGPTAAGSAPAQNNPLLVIAAVVFLVLFVLLENIKSWRVLRFSLRGGPRYSLVRQVRWPVIDMGLFKRLAFSATSLVSLVLGAGLIIAMADIPLFVDTVLSQNTSTSAMAVASGLALLRMTVMIPVGAILGGWLSERLSCRLMGVLGLLLTALGFYLMSQWPVNVGWMQITISTMLTGFGFGLVVAPISTTAIRAVRPTQAGMSAAIVTALRMLGMILALAALTSWGLAYFKHQASLYPPLPQPATADQFVQWTKGYAAHLTDSARAVYSAIFFTTMVLCLIGIVPALFLWSRKSSPLLEVEPALTVGASQATTPLPLTLAATETSEATQPAAPSPTPPSGRKRRLLLLLSALLLPLLLLSVVAAIFFWPTLPGNGQTTSAGGPPTTSSASGPRMIEVELNSLTLTSLFRSQLNMQGNTLSDLQMTPQANNRLVISFDLNLALGSAHRSLPVELDTTVSVDKQQHLRLTLTQVKRDGIVAGPTETAAMQKAVDQMVTSVVTPTLDNMLKSARLISVSTSSTPGCGGGAEMLTLLIKTPPVNGIAAQPTPIALCITQPSDLNKILSS